MSARTRVETLTDLADSINELTEIRHHAEIYETEIGEGAHRKRVRRRHIITLPGLIDSLIEAISPGSADSDTATGGFESRPAADLDPIHVLATITDQSGTWARALDINRSTLKGRLSALISAHHTDTQLGNLARDARGWLHAARAATGWEAANFTMNQPCPYCWNKNCLRVTGDLEHARCSKCGNEWDEMTIGLLGQMLTANAENETMTAARCDSLSGPFTCQRVAEHPDEHRDERGHYWRPTRDTPTLGTCA